MLFGRTLILCALYDSADRMDTPIAGCESGPCLDAAFVVTHFRLGKTQTLDDRRAAGRDQYVRTRDWLFMPGGDAEDANAVGARFDPRNPHALMNDDAITGKLGAHRRGKFFIFLRENPGFRQARSHRSRTGASLAPARAHPDRRRSR